mmetsp:Transcript_60214/g.95601  ORF Transcript_60214/g.95601 Transcript_60214/m.95601 type:complete len:187 (+) Transcript_60214:3-563(+)
MWEMFVQMAPNQPTQNEASCKTPRGDEVDTIQLCYNRGFTEIVAKSRPQIVVDNSNLLHQLWHFNLSQIESNLERDLQQFNQWISEEYNKTDDGNKRWPMKFFINAPMILAEREYHVTGERAIRINEMVKEKCRAHGWIILPYFDLTEAQMYDSSKEGMHPEGPLKMELVRMFIHIITQIIRDAAH